MSGADGAGGLDPALEFLARDPGYSERQLEQALIGRLTGFLNKIGPAEPEHVGKLTFYVNVVDELLRQPSHGDGATVGILLAGEREDVVVEYALRGVTTPLAVSAYTTDRAQPADVRAELPTRAELADVVRRTVRHTRSRSSQ